MGGNMKLLFIVTVSLILSAPTYAKEKIKKEKDGFYRQAFVGDELNYVVDTEAQICFAHKPGGVGYFTIPCSNLKKRSDWAQIITWE
jgi:hypothetical protein